MESKKIQVNKPQRIHLLGICGTAMSALACALHQKGHIISGMDSRKAYSPVREQLAQNKINYSVGYAAEQLPAQLDLIIVGNVIRADNSVLKAAQSQGIAYLSMPQAIADLLIADKKSIVVSGTHGKSSTTALVGHLLNSTAPTVLVGGIANNFASNFNSGTGDWFVIEGDEYDSAFFDKTPKFLKYKPHTAIISGIEYDHADIYPNLAAIYAEFRKFIKLVKQALIVCADDAKLLELAQQNANCQILSYGITEAADLRLIDYKSYPHGSLMTVFNKNLAQQKTFFTPMFGRHNLLNTLAAMLAAQQAGVTNISEQLRSFRGVARRQELIGISGGVRIYHDFAHHPTAIRETLKAFREAYPQSRLWAIFEPRSFTTSGNFFQQELAEAFADADKALFAPAFQSSYNASVPRLDTKHLCAKLCETKGDSDWAQSFTSIEGIADYIAQRAYPQDVVVCMSNGDFSGLAQTIIAKIAALYQ